MIVVLMGVAGAGKTTVGRMVARELGWEFRDADDLHSPGNVAKMTAGVPLSDEDRAPWLEELVRLVRDADQRNVSLVLACSALRRSFRRRLAAASPRLRYVYLRADTDRLRERLELRRGHYMRADLLASQLEVLEEPDDAITIDVENETAAETAARVVAAVTGLEPGPD